MKFSETSASVSVESLVHHTAKCLLELQTGCVEELHVSWGFDESTGRSNYEQKYKSGSHGLCADSSLLATKLIPLRLVQERTGVVVS